MNSKRLLKIILSVFVFVLLLAAVPCAVSAAADDELPALKSVQVEDVSFEEGMSCEYTYDIIYPFININLSKIQPDLNQ